MAKFINENPISEVLSYNVINRRHFLTEAFKHKDLLQALLSRLEMLPKNEIPYLFPGEGYDCKGQTVFDQAVKKRMISVVGKFLNLMVLSDVKGLLYSHIIERNVPALVKMGIDLKSYFSSEMVLYEIENPTYPQYHKSGEIFEVQSNASTIQQVINDYKTTIGDVLDNLP